MTPASPIARNAPDRAAVPAILQARLSDTLDLQARLKHAHWNVTGPNFIALHDLFDRL
jgi:starvation-inducible DNA-binding protein